MLNELIYPEMKNNTKHLPPFFKGSILAFTIVLVNIAGCQSVAPSASSGYSPPKTDYEKQKEDAVRQFLGRTFSIMLDRAGCNHPEAPYIRLAPDIIVRYYPSREPIRFSVDSIVADRFGRYLKLTLQDSTTAYIEVSRFQLSDPTDPFQLKYGCIFDIWPVELALKQTDLDTAERTKQAEAHERMERRSSAERAELDRKMADIGAELAKRLAEIEARAKLPGARLGMSANDIVNKTSWGKPDSVNRTVSASGVSEQWVYTDLGYLYFRNGRLVSIQTTNNR